VSAFAIVEFVTVLSWELKKQQTTKRLLRTRDLTLNKCMDLCRSEEVTDMQMKSLAEPEGINQVKSKAKKLSKERKGYNLARKFHANFVATNTHQSKRNSRHGEKLVIDAKKGTILLRNARKPSFTGVVKTRNAGISRNITEYHGISRNMAEYHGICRNHHGIWGNITEYHDIFREYTGTSQYSLMAARGWQPCDCL
jgi:hypothetical protein